jgi:hypothetical protein
MDTVAEDLASQHNSRWHKNLSSSPFVGDYITVKHPFQSLRNFSGDFSNKFVKVKCHVSIYEVPVKVADKPLMDSNGVPVVMYGFSFRLCDTDGVTVIQ